MGDRTKDELLRRRQSAEKAIDSGVVTLVDGYVNYGIEMKLGVSFDGKKETEVELCESYLGASCVKAHIGRKGDNGNFLEQNHPEDIIADIDEIISLREENEKIRAQVEGLKECVGLAVAQMLFPTMHSDRLMVVGRAIMEELDVDALIASWWENTKPKSISEIAKMKSFVGV